MLLQREAEEQQQEQQQQEKQQRQQHLLTGNGSAPANGTGGGAAPGAASGGGAAAAAAGGGSGGGGQGLPPGGSGVLEEQGGRTRSILRGSSSIQPDGSRVLSGGKAVHFQVARATGVTSNRDWGLLYASPELLRKRELTPKADVFAFGVLLYEMLSRRLVTWNDDSEQAQAYERSVRGGRINVKKHGDESLQLLAYAERVADGYRPQLPSHWPEDVTKLVDSCWAADPGERPSMEAVSQALAAMLKDRKMVKLLDSELPANMPQATTCACAIS
ncbi:hypothetical protein MNEG_7606 [Monoraphidium neglectum]|uniref:Protein kinase domain-containing protein n=1 Tax=Monoraphidium neglectum TaxID=145388 RepID=A0A0D2MI22_9CHLO|nr:hypothetical protein MNEG_7606 [Monoraphidium neglectum]KIZ00352.1 hypothetical protein MNEG_7606 [Monoraphidium neglectum]|eukprot:XP_013899371.1 hypothetical protein MNEG_7606 [Monoraphidium neglectum]